MPRQIFVIVALAALFGLPPTAAPAYASPLPVSANASAPAVVADVHGRLHVFVIGTDGFAYHAEADDIYQWSRWHSWQQLPGRRLTGGLAAIMRSDDSLEVFARAEDGAVVHNRRSCASWCGWRTVSSGGMFGSPAVINGVSGSPEIFVHGLDNMLWGTAATGNGYDDWSAWTQIQSPVQIVGDPTAIPASDRSPQIFIGGIDSEVYHSFRTAGGFTVLSRVAEITGGRAGRLGAAQYKDERGQSRPAVMTSTPSGGLFTKQVQTLNGPAFQPWAPALGNPHLEDLAGATANDGAAVMYARFTTDNTIRRMRVQHSFTSEWVLIGNGGAFSAPPAVYSYGGSHFAFGRGLGGQIWFTWDNRSNQRNWTTWAPL